MMQNPSNIAHSWTFWNPWPSLLSGTTWNHWAACANDVCCVPKPGGKDQRKSRHLFHPLPAASYQNSASFRNKLLKQARGTADAWSFANESPKRAPLSDQLNVSEDVESTPGTSKTDHDAYMLNMSYDTLILDSVCNVIVYMMICNINQYALKVGSSYQHILTSMGEYRTMSKPKHTPKL